MNNSSRTYSIYSILEAGQAELVNHGAIELDAKLEANILLSHVLAKPKSYLHAWPEQLLTLGQVAMYFAVINRRCNGEPIAYITGQKEFFSLVFNVDSSVLIPRPETELLVETILQKFKLKENDSLNILDLGTGSGAIAISLAKARPNWLITAVDNSEAALAVAQQNARIHNANNIKFINSNWFNNINKNNNKYHCIVSNPPYIGVNDSHLNSGDVRFEPKSALVANNNGLADIELIIAHSANYLIPKGCLIIEHGYNQLDMIKQILENYQFNVQSIKDYAGLNRVIVLESR
jgi:release factor glutamine methyltransferase